MRYLLHAIGCGQASGRAAAADRSAARRAGAGAAGRHPARPAPRTSSTRTWPRPARSAAWRRRSTTGRPAATARARVVHTYHGHVLEGYFSPAEDARVPRRRTRSSRASPIASSPSRRGSATSCSRNTRIGRERSVPRRAARLRSRRASRRSTTRAPGPRAHRARCADDAPRRHHRRPADGDQAARAVSRRGAAGRRARSVGRLPDRRRRRAARRARGRGARRWASPIACAFSAGAAICDTIYGATDVFLLTSRNEGTPVALIESLAAGVPGVSTDVGGVARRDRQRRGRPAGAVRRRARARRSRRRAARTIRDRRRAHGRAPAARSVVGALRRSTASSTTSSALYRELLH